MVEVIEEALDVATSTVRELAAFSPERDDAPYLILSVNTVDSVSALGFDLRLELLEGTVLVRPGAFLKTVVKSWDTAQFETASQAALGQQLFNAVQGACAVLTALALPTAQAVDSAPPRLEWAGQTTNSAVRLNLRGTTPAVFALEATTDFRTWTPVAINVLFQGQASFVDPGAGAYARRFYRARNTGEPPYVPGEVLVRWSANASATSVEEAYQTALLQRIGVIMTSAMQADGESGNRTALGDRMIRSCERTAGLGESPRVGARTCFLLPQAPACSST